MVWHLKICVTGFTFMRIWLINYEMYVVESSKILFMIKQTFMIKEHNQKHA